jgi:predicted nucleotidyltransferase
MNKTGLSKILKIFRRLNIPFVLAGGHAVAAWGVVRTTRDIDLLVEVSKGSVSKLVSELRQAGFKAALRRGDEGDPVQGVIRIESLDSSASETVDIILGIRRMPPGLFARASILDFLNIRVPVISPEDLIVLKLLAGGPIDLEDAQSILEIMKGKLDMNYLKSELNRCRLSLNKVNR